MVVVEGDPEVMQDYARAGEDRARGLRADARHLDGVLRALAARPCEVPLPTVTGAYRLEVLAGDWDEVDADVGEVGDALAAADSGWFGRLRLALVVQRIDAERRHCARPWQVDRQAVDRALAVLRDRDDHWFDRVFGGLAALLRHGPGLPDLDAVLDCFTGLTGPAADAVIAALSDDELRALLAQLAAPWPIGWSAQQRRHLYQVLGEKVSLATWRRFGSFTDEIDPPPAGAGADGASTDPATEGYFRTLRYSYLDGVLVAAGPGDGGLRFRFDDSRQGGIGDCYFIAAMQSLARHDPQSLARLIQPNPNGTYTVTFADGDVEVVSPDLPTDPEGHLAFAHNGGGADGGSELWPMLLEKAWAQKHGGWGPIVGGMQSDAIQALTGRPAGWIDRHDARIDDLADRMAAGEILGLSTIDPPDPATKDDWVSHDAPETFRRGSYWDHLYPDHAYLVVSVDRTAATVSVVNPWDPTQGPVVLTESELRESINGVYVNGSGVDGAGVDGADVDGAGVDRAP